MFDGLVVLVHVVLLLLFVHAAIFVPIRFFDLGFSLVRLLVVLAVRELFLLPLKPRHLGAYETTQPKTGTAKESEKDEHLGHSLPAAGAHPPAESLACAPSSV